MPRITVTLEDEQAAILDEKTGDGGEYDSKSEAVRSFIQEHQRLSERIDELETENQRLHRERRQLLEQHSENRELVRYAEAEKAYREAGLRERLKWWVWGREKS